MSQATVAWLTFAGTALVALGAFAGSWLKSRAESRTAKAAEMDAETNQLQALWDHVNRQDDKIETLEGKVDVLEVQAERDKDERHELKGALIYVVSVAKQAVAEIVEHYTNAQIARLPEPLRSHVIGHENFEDHIALTRPRPR